MTISDEFWVMDVVGNLVPAKYLMYKGDYVFDPDQSRAATYPIFTEPSRESKINQEPIDGLYPFIVPRNYSIESSLQYATGLRLNKNLGEFTEKTLIEDYLPNKSRDIQRTFEGSKGISVKAFRSIANWEPGFVSAAAGVPLFELKSGAAIVNRYDRGITSGDWMGNDPNNLIEMEAGYEFGRRIRSDFSAMPEKPSIPKPIAPPSSITDGNADSITQYYQNVPIQFPFLKMRYDGQVEGESRGYRPYVHAVYHVSLSSTEQTQHADLVSAADIYKAPDLTTAERMSSLSPNPLPVSQAGRKADGSAGWKSFVLSVDPAAGEGHGTAAWAKDYTAKSQAQASAVNIFVPDTTRASVWTLGWGGQLADGAPSIAAAIADEPEIASVSPRGFAPFSQEGEMEPATSRPQEPEERVPTIVLLDDLAFERLVLTMIDRACSGPSTSAGGPDPGLRLIPSGSRWWH